MLGVQVEYDNPVTRTITAFDIDRRFTFGVQSLVEANSRATAIRHRQAANPS
ncbi:hypothetical protein KCP73_04815 [Salmonella enterica subsp. enterica]|nr:hypothetical protein KCP73_04815 [Salmonella enterica subsp. enterica]